MCTICNEVCSEVVNDHGKFTTSVDNELRYYLLMIETKQANTVWVSRMMYYYQGFFWDFVFIKSIKNWRSIKCSLMSHTAKSTSSRSLNVLMNIEDHTIFRSSINYIFYLRIYLMSIGKLDFTMNN